MATHVGVIENEIGERVINASTRLRSLRNSDTHVNNIRLESWAETRVKLAI